MGSGITAADLILIGLRRVRQMVCFGRVILTATFLDKAAERGI